LTLTAARTPPPETHTTNAKRAQLGTEAEASASAAFLRAAAPARWVPVRKKGEWHHALCGLLAALLAPSLGRRPRPPGAAWRDTLGAVRAEVFAWVAKSERKHLPHGYPLAAALLCAEEEAPQLRAFVEGPLARAARERPSRGAALECLRAACAFYGAAHGRPAPGEPLWGALASAVAGLPGALRRSGGLSRAEPEQGECVAAIAAAAAQIDPALALETLLPELIAPRGEAPLGDGPAAGLRALTACCAVAGAGAPRGGGAPLAEATPAGLARACERIRAGASALGELGIGGALPAPLRAALGAAARAASATLPPSKPAVPLDAGVCGALVALLGAVPYALPDEWRGVRLADALTPFTQHADAAVRAAAAAALRRAVAAGSGVAAAASSGGGGGGARPPPALRSALLCAAAEQALRAAEDGGDAAAAQAVSLARSLAADWAAALPADADALGPGARPEGLDAPRLEGAALALAAQAGEPGLRRAALALLRDAAALGRALDAAQADAEEDGDGGAPHAAAASSSSSFFADAADAVSAECVRRACGALCAWPLRAPGAPLPHGATLDDAAQRAAGAGAAATGDAQRWAASLAATLAAAAPMCGAAVACARAHALRRLQALTPALCGAAADAAPAAALDAWRAAACLAAAAATPAVAGDAGGAKEAARAAAALLSAVGAPPGACCAAQLALRCASPAAAAAALDEAMALVAEEAVERGRGRARRAAELRTAAARILRAMAVAGRLASPDAAARATPVVDELARACAVPTPAPVLASAPSSGSASGAASSSSAASSSGSASASAAGVVMLGDVSYDELAQARAALCAAASCAPAGAWSAALRGRVWALAALWADGDRLDAERASAAARLSPRAPPAERAAAEAELAEAAEGVRCVAADACAQLAGAAAADGEEAARKPLAWAAAALERAHGGGAAAVLGAREAQLGGAGARALRAVGRALPSALPALLEGSYAAHGGPHAAAAHFSAFAEAYAHHYGAAAASAPASAAAQHREAPAAADAAPSPAAAEPPASLAPHVVLTAVLFRLCDARPGVRADAAALHAALPRALGGAGHDDAAAAAAAAAACSGAAAAAALCARLARCLPGTPCDVLAAEAASRAAAATSGAAPGVPRAAAFAALSALAPVLEGVSLPRAEASGAAAALLSSLFALTHARAPAAAASTADDADAGDDDDAHAATAALPAAQAEALWRALASRPPNAAAVLEFLHAAAAEALAGGADGGGDSDAGSGGGGGDDGARGAARARTAARCVRYCARACPRACVDALAAELARGRGDAHGRPAAANAAAALTLLCAAARERGDEAAPHAPALLHAALLRLGGGGMDDLSRLDDGGGGDAPGSAADAAAASAAAALLCRLLSCMAPAGAASAALRCRLRAGVPPGLWRGAGGGCALAEVCDALLAVLSASRPQLRDAWATEALGWATDAASPVAACRSAALLRALRPPLCQPAAAALGECLAACLAPARAQRAPGPAAAFAHACLAAMAASAAATPPAKLLLHPTAFWAAAAALRAPPPALAAAGARLLTTLLSGLPCGGPGAPPGVAEEVLLLAAPCVAGLPGAGAPGAAPFPGLARLALRCAAGGGGSAAPGGAASDAAACAAGAALLARCAALPSGGAADVLFGDAEARFALALGGALPWLLARGGGEGGEGAAEGGSSGAATRRDAADALAAAARARRGGAPLAAVLRASPLPPTAAVCEHLAGALTPAGGALAAAALLALLRGAPAEWHAPALALLAAVFDAPHGAGARPLPELSALTAAATLPGGAHVAAARGALAAALRAAARPGAAPAASLGPLWPEPDADAAAALLGDALAGAGAKRRDAPAFLFRA
jgi:hypothetical protein